MTGAGPLPRVALHVCCGPCATAVIERLAERFRVEAVWYNPNIHPEDEHRRRLNGMRAVAAALDIPLTELEYDVPVWDEACAGLLDEPEGGARCRVCYRLRLARVAEFAVGEGIEFFASTLTVSPHKPAAIINPIGENAAAELGAEFVAEDFGKRAGFARSIEMSREYGLYRQDYCGCRPSMRAGAE